MQIAQTLQLPGHSGSIQGPLAGVSAGTLGGLLSRAIPIVFAIAGVGLFVMILASGFQFLTSAGDAKKIEGAKQRLTNALVGFVLIFSAFWIVQIFGTIFGLDSINNTFR